jgi:hypothetical protein
MTETMELEKNTTKNINEQTVYNLKNTLTEYMIQANSPYNDGWTQEFYQQEAEKIEQQLKLLTE